MNHDYTTYEYQRGYDAGYNRALLDVIGKMAKYADEALELRLAKLTGAAMADSQVVPQPPGRTGRQSAA